MKYTVINPFPVHKSKGTWDDVFDNDKYDSIEAAWEANDYVKGDYVQDKDEIIHIRLKYTKTEEIKYYKLVIQKCYFGIDARDDEFAYQTAIYLLQKQ